MDDSAGKLIVLVAFAALLVMLLCSGKVGLRVPTKPALADNEHQIRQGDDWIVGDSNTRANPNSRLALAATRFGPVPGMPAPLRQITRGGIVRAQII